MAEPLIPEEIDVANTEALEELAWAIEAAQGEFKLILARCNYVNLRDRLVQQLQKLCAVPMQTLTLTETAQTLYATIRAELGEQQPAALMVFGLESVRDLDQVLTATNQVREEFRKHFHFPLVLWIHDDVLKKLVRLAPDFESWATVAEFAIAPNTLLQTLHQETQQLFAALLDPKSNRSFQSRLEFLAHLGILQPSELESALQALQGQGQIEPELQAGLDFSRGLNAADKSVGLQYFQQSLEFWQQQAAHFLGNTSAETEGKFDQTFADSPKLKVGLLLFYIGLYRYVLVEQARQGEADWRSVQEPLQRSVEIFEQAQRPNLVAHCLIQLGRVLQKLKAWDELETVANRAIALRQYYNSQVRFAQNYGFIARLALEQQQWQKAKQAALAALEIMEQQPENQRWFQGLYLLFLAQAQRALGETSHAIATLVQAKQLGDQGYPKFYIRVLNELRDLYHSQKQYLEAFQAKQIRLSVEQQYGIRAFVGAGRLQPKREAVAEEVGTRQHEQQVAELGDVAPEIVASGRQQDLEALLQRIGRNDCKLIVVHGLSGVGKSSLVAAGLVPALQHRAIGTQENLPVLMRKYTDWVEVLGQELAQALSAIAQQRELATLQGRTFQVKPTAKHTLPTILERLRQNEQDNLRTILIFDQFEEFFFACTEPLQRRQFFEFLGECLNVLSLKVVLSLREDYLHYLLECNRLESMKIIEQDILGCRVLYGLGNFTSTAAKAIIQNLTERAQFYLEPALVDRVVGDLAGELEEVRPIELQIVGAQLQTEAITTLEQYDQRGPKQELVKRYLSEVVEDCGPENHDVAELVLYLLTDEKGTRPLKTRAELERDLQALVTEANGGAKKLDLVLQIFVESGLVVLLKESPADRYQLVHDYLAAFIRQQQEPKLQALMAELEKERQQRKLGEDKLNKFLKRALIGSVAAGFCLAALATVAFVSARQANEQSQQAERQRQQAEEQRQRAELSEITALNTSSEVLFASNQTFDALVKGLQAASQLQHSNQVALDRQMETAATLRQAIYATQERNRLETHNGSVYSVSFSPDGKTIASASDDNTIKLWNLQGQEIKSLKGHNGYVLSVSFSPDGKTIASASGDNTIKLWNLQGQEIKSLKGHNGSVYSVSFSPDGKTIASASDDNTIKLWNFDFQDLVTRSCTWLGNYLITHPESLLELKSCQTSALVRAAAPTLVVQGEELARRGNVGDAVTKFQQALAWNSELKLEPKQKAQDLAQSQQLLTEGEDLAKQENLQGTIAKFKEAVKLDPSLEIKPENQAKQLVAAALTQKAQALVEEKKYKEASSTYAKAQELEPDTVVVDFLNSLCWQGSLNGAAQDVLKSCEQVASLAPEHGGIRDSRGVARALTGNAQGAIADFQAFINWVSEENQGSDAKEVKAQRQRWIIALKAGKNPFTPEELKKLREE
ncbi:MULTISPECIES: WD40 repeat domain-containing protein [Trichocoleus]|uniref:AAA family ATPase n=1 Tax=Trichocoleus desertorum GB2-A4 TaxID=2933944 RepID=A0ABV0JAH3_9CYAN|nr:WD40 repeat domain-containing protein [Trichocoleus sp. FACHB-46]MBD1861499.1 AAA family ATPase [Trichocoleus sp. FACHB-46]